MEFNDVMLRRTSCRKFEDRPVPRDLLEQCAEAGRLAPSGCNLQRWMFVVVDDDAKRAGIAEAVYDEGTRINVFADKIPAFLVMVTQPREATDLQQRILAACEGDFVHAIDFGCAAMQICLAATDLGLGSLMMGKVDQKRVRALLGIPDDRQIPLIIGLGYPHRWGKPRARLPIGDVLRWNAFQEE